MQKLREQEEQIALRLDKKKQKKLKLEQTTRKITTMDPKEILEKTKIYKENNEKQDADEKNQEELEKLLFKSAVRHIESEKQPIMLCR